MKYPRFFFRLPLAIALFLLPALRLQANEEKVNNLIATILEASPQERAKFESYKKTLPKRSPRQATAPSSTTKQTPQASSSLVPNMGVPESEVLDASAKFPKDIRGKYVWGTVTFKALRNYEGEPFILFTSKNGRMFSLYTRDPAVLQTFSQLSWGTKFTIPRDCPLRLLARDLLPGTYVVRMPYDSSNRDHTIGELNRDFGDTMKSDLQDLGESFKQLGDIFATPSQ